MATFYDYKELVNNRTCFETLIDFLGYNKTIKLLEKLPKEEFEYVLETDDITRILCTKEYEEMRNKHLIKFLRKQSKTLDEMYEVILCIKESVDQIKAKEIESLKEDEETNDENDDE